MKIILLSFLLLKGIECAHRLSRVLCGRTCYCDDIHTILSKPIANVSTLALTEQ